MTCFATNIWKSPSKILGWEGVPWNVSKRFSYDDSLAELRYTTATQSDSEHVDQRHTVHAVFFAWES